MASQEACGLLPLMGKVSPSTAVPLAALRLQERTADLLQLLSYQHAWLAGTAANNTHAAADDAPLGPRLACHPCKP